MEGYHQKIKQIKNEIDVFQKGGNGHPYTCENESKNHPPLETAIVEKGLQSELTLKCSICEWEQDIPRLFKEIYRMM